VAAAEHARQKKKEFAPRVQKKVNQRHEGRLQKGAKVKEAEKKGGADQQRRLPRRDERGDEPSFPRKYFKPGKRQLPLGEKRGLKGGEKKGDSRPLEREKLGASVRGGKNSS